MSGERIMWQTVVYRAFIDATADTSFNKTTATELEKQRADSWIRGNGKDFREVCGHAGMDPDFLHEAYVSGRINRELLRGEGCEFLTQQRVRSRA